MQNQPTQNNNEETPDIGHNTVGCVAGQRLISFVERIERMQVDIDEAREDQKEIYAEAKGVGYDVKILRKVVARRKMDREKRQEEDELLGLYESAMAGLNSMME